MSQSKLSLRCGKNRGLIFCSLLAFACVPSATLADTLTVHEWGTFTTLSSSSGESLSGMYKDVSRLPRFVHGLPFFNYDSATGWPSPEKLKNVTVKMETPVLYFYSDKERDINVDVGFQGGSISQWYPQRITGEANPQGNIFDFANPYQGSIQWKAKILKPGTSLRYTSPSAEETAEWNAPRNTDANLLKGQAGEIEKFLFYRGIGNFPLSLETHFTSDSEMAITNRGPVKISHILVYEYSDPENLNQGSQPTVWWEGELAPLQTIKVKRKAPNFSEVSAATQRLKMATMAAGLFYPESDALIATWANSYFTSEAGLKIFWLVPREEIDRILPLKITPSPRKLERVIVGRSEILTPEFEQKLAEAYHANTLEKYAKDKYYLAYLNYLSRHGMPEKTVSMGKGKAKERSSRLKGIGYKTGPGKFSRKLKPGNEDWFNLQGQRQ